MSSLRVILITMLLIGGIVSSHAEVRSFKKLNVNEQLALEESERRLAVYDHQLTVLDQLRSKGRISEAYYESGNQQLTLLIREEAQYQNAIIVRDPQLPQIVQDLWETTEHVASNVGLGIATIVGKCPQLLTLFGMIH